MFMSFLRHSIIKLPSTELEREFDRCVTMRQALSQAGLRIITCAATARH
jgi:hypothetical protein